MGRVIIRRGVIACKAEVAPRGMMHDWLVENSTITIHSTNPAVGRIAEVYGWYNQGTPPVSMVGRLDGWLTCKICGMSIPASVQVSSDNEEWRSRKKRDAALKEYADCHVDDCGGPDG